MNILDDKTFQVIWSWSDLEKAELEHRFKNGVLALLEIVRESRSKGEPALSETDVDALTAELEEAATVFDECAVNCFALASTLRAERPDRQANEDGRDRMPPRLKRSCGKKVLVSRTNIEELRNRTVTLDDVDGEYGIVGEGDDFWKTPLNRVVVLPTEEADSEEAETP